ncbi:MAG TPA: hypothetical protein VIJ51_11835 [Solirubrobacteraceae bacterium]
MARRARGGDDPERRSEPDEQGEPAGGRTPANDDAQGSDFSLEPAPARSDQLPEDAPEPVAPD